MSLEAPEKIQQLLDTYSYLQTQLSQLPYTDFLHECISYIGLLKYIETNGTFDDIQDVYIFIQHANEYASRPNFSPTLFLTRIQNILTNNETIARTSFRGKENGVQILTAYSSKGLEYDVVIIPENTSQYWGKTAKKEQGFRIPFDKKQYE